MKLLDDKVVLVTGGTGSLGKVLTKRLLSGAEGKPRKVIIFSRDEAKQHFMRLEYQHKKRVTDEVIYHNFARVLEFRIGDVRDYHSISSVLKDVDIVVNAAALKQVPSCEYFPFEAILTNIVGAENIVRVIRENRLKVQRVIGVSTDKACKPVNVMGMSKSLQERIFTAANVNSDHTSYVCVRYGNVLASRGSVIPLFHEQIANGGPVTITTTEMTRFLMPLDKAVDTILTAIGAAQPGEIYVPRIPAARIVDVTDALIGARKIKKIVTGIRPGEKIHEVMVSEEEGWRTFMRSDYYVIKPMLPELVKAEEGVVALNREYSSNDALMTSGEVEALLVRSRLMVGEEIEEEGEVLR